MKDVHRLQALVASLAQGSPQRCSKPALVSMPSHDASMTRILRVLPHGGKGDAATSSALCRSGPSAGQDEAPPPPMRIAIDIAIGLYSHVLTV